MTPAQVAVRVARNGRKAARRVVRDAERAVADRERTALQLVRQVGGLEFVVRESEAMLADRAARPIEKVQTELASSEACLREVQATLGALTHREWAELELPHIRRGSKLRQELEMRRLYPDAKLAQELARARAELAIARQQLADHSPQVA